MKGEKHLITQARFDRLCTQLEEHRGPPYVEIETIAYSTVSNFISERCSVQLLREGGELSGEESETGEETEGDCTSEQEVEQSEESDPAWNVPRKRVRRVYQGVRDESLGS